MAMAGRWGLGLLIGLVMAQTPAMAELRPRARPEGLAVAAPEEVASASPSSMPPAEVPVPEAEPNVGAITGLPLPRFVSLKSGEGNARRGPSLDHRIDWVFLRADMPLKITAEYDNWRRVEDRDGMGGWVHYALLSGARTVIVETPMLPLRARADPEATETALIEAGVIAAVDSCEPDWCRISAGGYYGWAPKTALWGVEPGETFDQ